MVLHPSRTDELRQLYDALAFAVAENRKLLATSGTESGEFAAAEATMATILRRIKEIRGQAGKHWLEI